MIKRVDHIAIAVNSADDALSVFDNLFGLKADHMSLSRTRGLRRLLCAWAIPISSSLSPPIPRGGVAKFIEKRGEGFHHICIEVDNIDEELRSLAARGVELIDKQARKGLAGRIGFLHPRATKGVLIELVQKV
ncbi:hypothetical protein ES703_28348 [subsurface metagenome]